MNPVYYSSRQMQSKILDLEEENRLIRGCYEAYQKMLQQQLESRVKAPQRSESGFQTVRRCFREQGSQVQKEQPATSDAQCQMITRVKHQSLQTDDIGLKTAEVTQKENERLTQKVGALRKQVDQLTQAVQKHKLPKPQPILSDQCVGGALPQCEQGVDTAWGEEHRRFIEENKVGAEFHFSLEEIAQLSTGNVSAFKEILAKAYWEKVVTLIWDHAQQGIVKLSWRETLEKCAAAVNKLYERKDPYLEHVMSSFLSNTKTSMEPPKDIKTFFIQHPYLTALLWWVSAVPAEICFLLARDVPAFEDRLVKFMYLGCLAGASHHNTQHIITESLKSENPKAVERLWNIATLYPPFYQELCGFLVVLSGTPEYQEGIKKLKAISS